MTSAKRRGYIKPGVPQFSAATRRAFQTPLTSPLLLGLDFVVRRAFRQIRFKHQVAFGTSFTLAAPSGPDMMRVRDIFWHRNTGQGKGVDS